MERMGVKSCQVILFRGVCPIAQALASIYVLGVVTVYSDLVDQNGVKSQAFGTVLTQPPLECVSVSTDGCVLLMTIQLW